MEKRHQIHRTKCTRKENYPRQVHNAATPGVKRSLVWRNSRQEKLPKNQALVVQRVDNAIQRMNHYSPLSVVITYNAIHWMVMKPTPGNTKRIFLHTQQHLIKGHNIHTHIKLSLPCEKRIRNTVNGMLGDSLQSITLNP